MTTTLNENEQQAASIFKSLVDNGVSNQKLQEWMLATEERLNMAHSDINWLKVAVKLDSKKLIDTVFHNYKVTPQEVEDAATFGSAQTNSPKISTIDKIAENLVKAEYDIKHSQQSPNSNLRDSDKQYSSLSTVEYLKEKFVDFFKKKSEIKDRVGEMRKKFLNNNNSNETKLAM